MNFIKRKVFFISICFALSFVCFTDANAQKTSNYEVLTDAALTRVIPTSFYFAGQSAETQMRNAVAAKLGENRFVIAGLVDTSGYSTEISGKYEGFFITDSVIKIGGKKLSIGAFGFGFSKNGKVNIFDLSSKEILSVSTVTDSELKRPRPLMMSSDANGIRLYKGKDYVLISPN